MGLEVTIPDSGLLRHGGQFRLRARPAVRGVAGLRRAGDPARRPGRARRHRSSSRTGSAAGSRSARRRAGGRCTWRRSSGLPPVIRPRPFPNRPAGRPGHAPVCSWRASRPPRSALPEAPQCSCPAGISADSQEVQMADQTASDVLADRLIDWGVEVIFGLPGDGINGFMEALRTRADRLRYVHVRHEEVAAMAACRLRQVHREARGVLRDLGAGRRSPDERAATTPRSSRHRCWPSPA